MEYLNQFHKDSTERKMKKIQDFNNSPITYETIMQQQKRRERLAELYPDQDKNNSNEKNE